MTANEKPDIVLIQAACPRLDQVEIELLAGRQSPEGYASSFYEIRGRQRGEVVVRARHTFLAGAKTKFLSAYYRAVEGKVIR